MKGKVVYIDTKSNLEAKLKEGTIPSSAMVFIKDVGLIYFNGTYFGAYSVLSKTSDGLAPKGGDKANSLISNVDTEWVLTVTSGASPSWRKLPANAFKNSIYTLPSATTTSLGGLIVGSVNTSAFANLTGNYYKLNIDKNGLGYVNVPWTDVKVTNTLLTKDTKFYLTGTTSNSTNTGTLVFDSRVYVDANNGSLVAGYFRGNLTGHATSSTRARYLEYYTIVPFGSTTLNKWYKFATIKGSTRYSSGSFIANMYIGRVTNSGKGDYCTLSFYCYQQNALGETPAYQLIHDNTESLFVVRGILNYDESGYTVDLYAKVITQQYQNLLLCLIGGDAVIQPSTDGLDELPSGTEIIPEYSKKVLQSKESNSTHNIVGGALGSIPYQTASGTTSFLAAPTTNGYVLKYDTTNKKPYWTTDNNSNSWRSINIYDSDGTTSLGSLGSGTNTGAFSLIEGSNVTFTYSSGKLTIAAKDTWTAWKGATSSAAGTAGYMPAPTSAQRNQFLRGDGTWVSLNNYALPTASSTVLGGVKTGDAITTTTGYTAVNIKDGVLYFKNTDLSNYVTLNSELTITGTKTFSNSIKTNVIYDATSSNKITLVPHFSYGDLGVEVSSTAEVYLKAWLKKVCELYPGSLGIFIGTVSHDSTRMIEVYIYSTSKKDSETGLPQHSFGICYSYSRTHHYTFGTLEYVFGCNIMLTNSNYTSYTYSKSSIDSKIAAIANLQNTSITTYAGLMFSGIKGYVNTNTAIASNDFVATNSSAAIGWGKDNSKVLLASQASKNDGTIFIRQYYTSWGAWNKLLHSGNFTDYIYSKSQTDDAISKAIADLVGSAPETLNTLEEISKYLEDGTVAGGLLEQLSNKVDKTDTTYLKTYTRKDIGTSPNFDDPGINGVFEVRNSSETTGESGTKPFNAFGPMLSVKAENVILQIAAQSLQSLKFRSKQSANVTLKDIPWRTLLDSVNYTNYLGYIGTTKVQDSSAAQALTGITSITATEYYKKDSSNDYILLGGGGHKKIDDLVVESNITTIRKTLTVTQDWMDTGIKYQDLSIGTYIVQVYVNANNSTGLMYLCYFSGVMSWYNGGTNDSDSDEIILHRSGHAYGNTIYLRTIMSANSDGRHLRLQIAANKNLGAAYTYTFKFKKMI